MKDALDKVTSGPAMGLIAVYVAFMTLGDFADYFIGLAIEHQWPELSLPIFLALYFLSLWLAWRLALAVTEPRRSR